MPLREVFEKLATDFAYEILAIVLATPVREAVEVGRRSRRSPRGQAPDATLDVAPVRPRPWYASTSRIRIPAEKHQVSMDDLPLSDGLADVLWRERYAFLGDLDGHTLADLTRHPGFGRECHRELRCLLETQGTIWSSTARATWSTPPPAPVVVTDEVRPRSERTTVERPVRAKPVRARPRKKLDRASVIRVPREHAQLRIEHMPVTARLYNALARNGYVVLGDLDGRSLGHLHQHRGFGRVCLEDLLGVLLAMRIVPAVPAEPILQVPTFALEYRFDELRLSRPVQLFARHYGLTVLGDIHGVRLPPARTSVIHELTSMIEAMTSTGPPESVGLLDHLDAGLDRLKERHRDVLVMRFGGAGEAPLKPDDVGRRISLTRQRVRQLEGHALAILPALSGPPFCSALRDLGDRVSAEGADVAAELERSWRKEPPDSARVPRPWANNGFYLRLLTKLSRVIEAAVFPPTAPSTPGSSMLPPAAVTPL